MRRFVPSHNYRTSIINYRVLLKSSMNVDDYYKKMDIAMIRDNTEEDRKVVTPQI